VASPAEEGAITQNYTQMILQSASSTTIVTVLSVREFLLLSCNYCDHSGPHMNNRSEGWHNRVKRQTRKAHPKCLN